MTTRYDNTPVTGYGEGLVTSDEQPVRVSVTFNDNRRTVTNDYFEIDGKFYNVHPYCKFIEVPFDGRKIGDVTKTVSGFPVRWVDNSAPDGWPVTAVA